MLESLALEAMEPKIQLVAYTNKPYGIAVASARTCYAADFVFVGQLTPKGERTRMTLLDALPRHEEELAYIGDSETPHEERLRLVETVLTNVTDDATRDAVMVFADLARQRSPTDDRIAKSIYEAGHHTPFQHPTFVFALEGISRNVVESFFHQHMFYNSEQQSQRYVEMKKAQVIVPDSIANHDAARAVFDAAVVAAWQGYHVLRNDLVDANLKVMSAIGKIKGLSEKASRKEAEKKSQEMARYVIPIAASTKLYHTVSGIVLLRYIRMCKANNVPEEAAAVVNMMVDAVRDVDPEFFDKITEEPHAPDNLLEWQLDGGELAVPDLDGHTSKLIHHTGDAATLVGHVWQEVAGQPLDVARVMDPAQNKVWNDTLNTWDHSPVLRALRHVHLTYRKRQSLTAYAQDQRHRTTPGTRPLLHQVLSPTPDVYTPDVISGDTLTVYNDTVETLWNAVHKLIGLGIPAHDAVYLLPNATNMYYTQSGDLLGYIHKWRLRLCFNAQKEIFEAAIDELRQAQEVMPELTQFLGPPCLFIAARQPTELQDDVDACCPEGPRWCGVKVWKNFDAAQGKPKRPY